MRLNNPGRPIPADRVLGFASRQDSNAFLLANLGRRVNGAVHFNASGAAVSYVLQTNSTVRKGTGRISWLGSCGALLMGVLCCSRFAPSGASFRTPPSGQQCRSRPPPSASWRDTITGW